jgi:hypothetical protein
MNKITLLFLILFGHTYAQIPFPVDTIAYNERFNNRMFADFNSAGLLKISFTSGLGTVSANNEIYYAEEGVNGNFTLTNLTNNTVDDNYPTLSIDQNDNVHICYESRDPNIFQVRYINNISGSFSSPIEITQGGLNKATPFGKIGPDSVMHFVYYTYVTGTDNFFYKSYDLRTNTLGPEILLSNGEASGDFEATLDVDSNGKVHIVGRSGTGTFSGPLKYFNNVSGSFQEIPTGVTVNINYPRVKIDSNDKVHIVYRANSQLYYINNVNGTFTSSVAITPAGQLPAGIQSLEKDNLDRLYLTYQSSQSASGKGFYLIYSENGVFSDTLLISDISNEYVTRNSSQVVTNGSDKIALFYAPGGIRNSQVICDIFMKRGNLNSIVPVELISFDAGVSDNDVYLVWQTASETNNRGFAVERRSQQIGNNNNDWTEISFITGASTTTETRTYSYIDADLPKGGYAYRLKQIDLDGSFTYSKELEIHIDFSPQEFLLEQNYPNPFNPTTKISWQSPISGHQTLKVFDMLGREVTTLVDEYREAGSYKVEFPINNLSAGRQGLQLSSGVYFYQLQIWDSSSKSERVFMQTKQMILLK